MRAVKAVGSGIKTFMILFSFVVNLVLIIVVVALLLMIFDIKNNIAQPLVQGLHSSFVGLDEATIDWTIPVRDTIPIKLDIPLETDTTVVLTQPVPLSVNATINLPGVGTLSNAVVNLSLPAGLSLPVHLDLDVPVDQQLDVALDVRAVIPLSETQLHDPFENLRLIFEPLALGLDNLPDNFDEAGVLVSDLLAGRTVDLLAETDYARDPWTGFSRTAGLGYMLGDVPAPLANRPMPTGIVPIGGIRALDEQIRPEVYAEGGPEVVNARAIQELLSLAVPPYHFDGSYAGASAQTAPVTRVEQPADPPDASPVSDDMPAGGG